MKIRKITGVLGVFLSIAVLCSGQTGSKMPIVIPPSPNAQSFLQYGDYPVSHHTGIPDISIPLYTIELSDISVPIVLTYNASGIKVNEEAGRVGLGWTLNAGGVISRTIIGDDDFNAYKLYSYLGSGAALIDYTLSEGQLQYPVIHGCTYYFSYPAHDLFSLLFDRDEHYDLSPDRFQYSFNGYTGGFALLRGGGIYKEKGDNIIFNYTRSADKKTTTWTATTPDGTVYSFDRPERHTNLTSNLPAGTGTGTWYLTQIKTLNGNIITFKYNFESAGYYYLGNIVQDYTVTSGLTTSNFNESILTSEIVTLDKISFPNGEIIFDYYKAREDHAYEPRLGKITIKNTASSIQEIDFTYDYFNANVTGKEIKTIEQLKFILGTISSIWGKVVNEEWNKKRLKLTDIEFSSGSEKQTYHFTYNETNLPTKLSTGRDHWGYFNNEQNTHLIPAQTYKNPLRAEDKIEGGLSYFPANREVNPDYNQAFILNKITYPTGGYTTFKYESNQYNTSIFEGDPLRKNFLTEQKEVNIAATPGYRPPVYGDYHKQEFSIGYYDGGGSGKAVKVNLTKKVIFKTNRNGLETNQKEFIVTLKNARTGKVIHQTIDTRAFYSFYDNDLSKKEISVVIRNIELVPGDYELIVAGDLRRELDSFFLDLAWVCFPESYIMNHPVSYAGGLRISEIKSYTSENQLAKIKSFEYDNQAAKLVTGYPRYHHMRFSDKDRSTYLSSEGLRSHKAAVGYGLVTVYEDEKNGKNGKTVYKYTIKPDMHLDYSYRAPGFETLPSNYLLPFDHTPAGASGLDISYAENGLPEEETYYKKNSSGSYSISKQILYDYLTTSGGGILWGIMTPFTSRQGGGTFLNFVCQFTDKYTPLSAYLHPVVSPQWARLVKKTEITATDTWPVRVETSYTYNNKRQLVSETVTNSDEKIHVTEYKYTSDVENSTTALQRLITLNCLDKVFEVKKTTGNTISILANEYALFNNIPRLSVVKTNTGPSQAMEEKVKYQQYTSRGNPLYITTPGNEQVVYLWGYNYQYPVAKILNASYSQVSNLLSQALIDRLAAAATPSQTDLNALNQLRSDTTIPEMQVITYTYKPLVGISEMIDERGVKTTYQYDVSGRLTGILDHNGRKIETYDYHFRNQ